MWVGSGGDEGGAGAEEAWKVFFGFVMVGEAVGAEVADGIVVEVVDHSLSVSLTRIRHGGASAVRSNRRLR